MYALDTFGRDRAAHEQAVRTLRAVCKEGTTVRQMQTIIDAVEPQNLPTTPAPTVYAVHALAWGQANPDRDTGAMGELYRAPYAILWQSYGEDDITDGAHLRLGYTTIADAVSEIADWYTMTDGGVTYAATIIDVRVAPCTVLPAGTEIAYA